MKNKYHHLRIRLLGGRPARISGARLLLPLSALMSLAFAGHFLAGLRAADAPSFNAIFVARQAVNDRLTAASSFQPATVNDVVAKALAFKAMLTTAQQQALEQTYTRYTNGLF